MFFDNAGAPIRKEYSIDEFSEGTLGSLGAAFRQSFTETVSGSTWRSDELIRANLGKGEVTVGSYSPSRGQEREIVGFNDRITNEDAQRQIDESGLPLKVPDDGFTQQGLDIVMDRKRNELMRKKQMEDAKGFTSGVGQFTAGMIAQVLDPVNVAASFVPVVSTAKYAQWIASQSSGLGRAGVRAGVGAAEGLVGAALIEPIIYLNLQREQADYTMADSLINVGLGSVLGGGLHMGVGAYKDAIAKGTRTITEPKGEMPKALENASPETRKALLETSVSMEAQGYRVDVNTIAEADPKFKAPKAEVTKVQDAPAVEPHILYHGSPRDFDAFDVAKIGSTSDKGIRGRGFYLTPNKKTAGAYAKNTGDTISQVEATYTNPLDLHTFNSAMEVESYLGLPEGSVKYRVDELPSGSFKSISVAEDYAGVFTSAVKDKGHDAILHGQEVVVFDPSKLKIVDKDIRSEDGDFYRKPQAQPETPKPVPSVETAVKTAFSPENMRGVDKAASVEAEKSLSLPERDIDQELEGVSDLLAEYERMNAQTTDLSAYDQAIAKATQDAEALRAATLCGLTR